MVLRSLWNFVFSPPKRISCWWYGKCNFSKWVFFLVWCNRCGLWEPGGNEKKGPQILMQWKQFRRDPKHIAFTAQTLRGVTKKKECKDSQGRIFCSSFSFRNFFRFSLEFLSSKILCFYVFYVLRLWNFLFFCFHTSPAE